VIEICFDFLKNSQLGLLQIQVEHEFAGLSDRGLLVVDLGDDGVEGVAHLVAHCRIHDTHVLALNLSILALDAQGDVLNLEHHFVVWTVA